MKRFIIVLSIFISISISSVGLAEDFYVAKSGDDTGNNCQIEESPCLTIQRAIDQVDAEIAENYIYISPGTYFENLTNNTKSIAFIGEDTAMTIIDGSQEGPVYKDLCAADHVAIFQYLTIQNGVSEDFGGGISMRCYQEEDPNNGYVYLYRSEVKNNSADLFGGGVYVSGNNNSGLVVEYSTISDNSAQIGGGVLIALAREGYFKNTTIENNNANTSGEKKGGGIASNGPDLEFENVTIANNSASDGNGGGLSHEQHGEITFSNTILDNNTGGNCSSEITSEDHNISSDDTCGFDQENDLESTDPLLDDLADNGGYVRTMALLTDSPAINSGSNDLCQDNDSRGIERPQQVICDIGSYEANCGDEIVQGTEECDDGNDDNNDNCSNTCEIIEQEVEEEESEESQPEVEEEEESEEETDSEPSEESEEETNEESEEEYVCGNSEIESGETCDDGNTDSLDGCSSICEIETNSDLEEVNEDVNFDQVETGEVIILTLPEPLLVENNLNFAVSEEDCECQWSISPESFGEFNSTDLCTVELTIVGSTQANISSSIDCGENRSAGYNQTIIVDEAISLNPDISVGCSLSNGRSGNIMVFLFIIPFFWFYRKKVINY